jgi:GNAT superfamily N-acetyltransferase
MNIERNSNIEPSEIEDLREAVGWDRSENTYGKILANLYSYYTCRDDGKLVAYLSVISDGVSDAFLVDFAVHPDCQGQGIGSQIVKRAISDLKTAGIRCIQVTFNPKLEAFYQKFGFHIFKAGIIDFNNMEIET